jgi:hypothetical protein
MRRSGSVDLLAAHGMPTVSIAEAAQWIAKRDALLQKFDATATP